MTGTVSTDPAIEIPLERVFTEEDWAACLGCGANCPEDREYLEANHWRPSELTFAPIYQFDDGEMVCGPCYLESGS